MKHLARALVPFACVLALAVGCGSSDETTGAGGSTGTTGAGGSGGSTTSASAGGGTMNQSASLSGVVTRSADIPDGLDGKGDLYIAVFGENPATNPGIMPLGATIVDEADLSAADAKVPYQIDDLPVSPKKLYAVAFLDDDGNATPDQAGPKKPDLVSFDGAGPVSFAITQPGTTTLDLDLNVQMPF